MSRTCTVEGCGRTHKSRGLCNTHYVRWFRTGDAGQAEFRRRGTDGCEVDGCNRDHLARGLCATHYKRWQMHGDVGSAEILEGVNSYSGAHLQVVRRHGTASSHLCRHCDGPAREWAYDHTDPEPLRHPKHGAPYSLDPERYMPLCRSCHRRFDLSVAGAMTS